jgi:hypothetical protein
MASVLSPTPRSPLVEKNYYMDKKNVSPTKVNLTQTYGGGGAIFSKIAQGA